MVVYNGCNTARKSNLSPFFFFPKSRLLKETFVNENALARIMKQLRQRQPYHATPWCASPTCTAVPSMRL